jgi:predicted esterase
MQAILSNLAAGSFGPCDGTRLYATGLSSGGYMTSRMAVSYPGRFKALAIQSASYATCGGAICTVPEMLPPNHPPTLFLHGQLDDVVPISTMFPYRDKLTSEGRRVDTVIDASAGHAWIAAAPPAVRAWFDASP